MQQFSLLRHFGDAAKPCCVHTVFHYALCLVPFHHVPLRLMGLKVIFSKQLPNMPKEYICRCVWVGGCVCVCMHAGLVSAAPVQKFEKTPAMLLCTVAACKRGFQRPV